MKKVVGILASIILVTAFVGFAEAANVPEWVKNNAGWWAEGAIDDKAFVTGVQFLIEEGIISVPSTTRSASTSDTIPAVLFGVPGTVASAATILDGFPMARNGEAGRAFGAAFSASVIGGLFGAILLGISIPALRPFMLAIASPELLAICIFGLSLAAVLAGSSPMKGLVAVCLGLIVAATGEDSGGGELR